VIPSRFSSFQIILLTALRPAAQRIQRKHRREAASAAVAIQKQLDGYGLDCFASLAMTLTVRCSKK